MSAGRARRLQRSPGLRIPSLCSGFSWRRSGSGRMSTATSPPRERACARCSRAACCPCSVTGGSITSPRRRCGTGSTPAAAPRRTPPTHALKLLRLIINFAIARGHVGKNPTQGIRPNRRPRLTRFLSRDEIARLHRVLDAETGRGNRQQADIIRLLLLTGCRRGEILGLRRSEVQADGLALADSKTGPRRVPLNTQAQRILDRQAADGQPLRAPVPARSVPAARPRTLDLGPGPQGSGHRGRAPARPPAFACEPRGDERRAGARRLADVRTTPTCG